MTNNNARAKIAAPKKVEALIDSGIKFIAPHEHKGFIQAWDSSTGEKLWELQIYKKNIDPAIEEDVQWVFITKLEMENGKLVVTNNKGDKYSVNIQQKQVEA